MNSAYCRLVDTFERRVNILILEPRPGAKIFSVGAKVWKLSSGVKFELITYLLPSMPVGSAVRIFRIFTFKIEDYKQIYFESWPNAVQIGATGGNLLNFNYYRFLRWFLRFLLGPWLPYWPIRAIPARCSNRFRSEKFLRIWNPAKTQQTIKCSAIATMCSDVPSDLVRHLRMHNGCKCSIYLQIY